MPSVTRTPARQAPRVVEQADDVAVRDAARRGVLGVHARDLAAAMLGSRRCARRNPAGCEAASLGWLATSMQRRAAAGARHSVRARAGWPGQSASPKPAIGLGENLDPAARRRQGCAIGILAECAQIPAIIRLPAATPDRRLPRTPSKLGAGRPASSRPARVGS